MIVSLTAYDRPDYLEQTLDALVGASHALDEPLRVVASVDRSEALPACVGLLLSYDPIWDVSCPDERIGLQANTHRALARAWEIAAEEGEDFVLHLEDDFVLSPDALRFHAWMREEYREEERVFFTGSYGCRTPEEVKPGWETKVYRARTFSCRAWGHWRYVWDDVLNPDWPWGRGHLKNGIPSEWGFFVNADIMHSGVRQILPELSRVMHIGIDGEHSNDWHYRKDWLGLPLADRVYDAAYYE